jgi:Fe-S-cluster-containing hydrogenase component 2
MCPPQSLKMLDGKPRFDLPDCIRCFCCQEHCPKGAIKPRTTLAMKAASLVEDSVRSLFGFGRKGKP